MAAVLEDTELIPTYEENRSRSLLGGTFVKMFTFLIKKGKFTKHGLLFPVFLLINGHEHWRCNSLAPWGNK